MLCRVVRAFNYAFEGVRVVRYECGEQELPQEVAVVAIAEKWAEPVKPAKPAEPEKPTADPSVEPTDDDGAAAEPTDEAPDDETPATRTRPPRRRR